jgi:hypothetical protein
MDTYAARIAPILNDAYVSLRRAAGPRTRDLVEARGIERGAVGILADVYFAILDHPIPDAGLAAVTRYADPVEVAASIECTAGAGLIVRDPVGRLDLTGSGRELMCAMAQTIAADRPVDDAVNEMLARLLIAGRADGGDAFAAMTPPYEPPDASAAMLFSHRLGALRHYRADAHAAAWSARGLSAAEMVALPAGDLRRAIEDDTNRRDEPIYAVLSDAEREAFHDGVRALIH